MLWESNPSGHEAIPRRGFGPLRARLLMTFRAPPAICIFRLPFLRHSINFSLQPANDVILAIERLLHAVYSPDELGKFLGVLGRVMFCRRKSHFRTL